MAGGGAELRGPPPFLAGCMLPFSFIFRSEILMSVSDEGTLTSTNTEKLVFLYEKVLDGVARKWRMTNTCSGRMVAV